MNPALNRRKLLKGSLTAGAALALSGCMMRADTRGFFERKGLPIGIQLYALGDEAKTDLAGTLKKVAAIGFREIEISGLLGRDPGAVRQIADDTGLKISSVHLGATGDFSVRTDPQRLADAFAILGARYAVLSMFPIPKGFKVLKGEDVAAAFTRTAQEGGEKIWTDLAQLLNERGALLKAHGISLGYHNHNVEFMQVGQRTAWEIIAQETDPDLVHFEADVGWIASAGIDPVAFFKRYSGRIRQLHVKDVKAGLVPNTILRTDPTEVGSGTVDWARVIPAAYDAGARHFYFEQEPPFAIPRIEAAAKSYSFLAQLRA
jgi:sugar phosphate isomerase/epimerase